jgi:tRNA nucleotidyltransferase (CCA-adding enzyme)
LNGFSGYVVEILVIYYGSFLDLLKQSLLWKEGTVIDPSNHHNKGQATFNLNRSKLNSPLIIIDPVDKNRNASAALSLEKFNHLKDAARKYLKSPHETFFRKEPFDYFSLAEKAKKGKLHLLFLEVKPLSGKDDVVGAKLLKAHHFIEQKLSRYQLKESGWEWVMDSKNNSARFYYLLSLDCLPSEEIRQGPPLDLAEFAADFRRKNKDTFVKDGRLFARIRNQNTLLKDYTSNLIAEPYLKERIKSIVQLKTI